MSKQVKSYFTGGRIIFVQSNVKNGTKSEKTKRGEKNVFLISDNFFFKYFIQWSKKTQQNWGSIDCFRVKNNCFPGETAILFFKLILGQYFPPYVKSSKKSFFITIIHQNRRERNWFLNLWGHRGIFCFVSLLKKKN